MLGFWYIVKRYTAIDNSVDKDRTGRNSKDKPITTSIGSCVTIGAVSGAAGTGLRIGEHSNTRQHIGGQKVIPTDNGG